MFFAVSRGWQCRHAADTRVKALGNALDRAALACGIAPFKQHNQPVAGGFYPVLQTHQLALQTHQFAKIGMAEAAIGW